MTTRKEALIALRDKVRDGDEVAVKEIIFNDVDGYFRKPNWLNVGRIMQGSLDAAVALLEAVLPGWGWTIDADGAAQVWRRGPVIGFHSALNDTPACALLLAILEAKIAEEE